MAFEKNNTFGQKSSRKNIPNKSTSEIRKAFEKLIQENLKQIQEDLEDMKPELRVRFLLDMARFVLPTLKSQSIETDFKSELDIPIIRFFNTEEEN